MKLIFAVIFSLVTITTINAQTASSEYNFDLDMASVETVSVLDIPGNQSVMIDLTKFQGITSLQLENLESEVVYTENLSSMSAVSIYQLDLELFEEGYYTLVINTSNGPSYQDIEVN